MMKKESQDISTKSAKEEAYMVGQNDSCHAFFNFILYLKDFLSECVCELVL
jgi:hypothetical protein